MPTEQSGTMSAIVTFLPMILLFGLMYVILILPQKKKEKKTREMLNNLTVGDKVVSIGGISGKIINIKDDEITVETSVEKTQVVFKKWAIKEVDRPVQA
jgi:preprotein translocase subunit YajC